MASGNINIANSGNSIEIDDLGGVQKAYVPKEGASVSNNVDTVFIQTSDNKKFTIPYADIALPVTANILELVDTIEGWLDENITTQKMDDLNRDFQLFQGNSYRASISKNSVAAPEDMILFKNASGTKYMRIRSIDLYFNVTASVSWETYLNPTITADGTLKTSVNNKTDGGAGAEGQLYDAPTISAAGTLIRPFMTDTNRRVSIDQPLLLLAPGENLLIRRLNGGAGNEFRYTITWDEVTL
jgi:hypothetical protein